MEQRINISNGEDEQIVIQTELYALNKGTPNVAGSVRWLEYIDKPMPENLPVRKLFGIKPKDKDFKVDHAKAGAYNVEKDLQELGVRDREKYTEDRTPNRGKLWPRFFMSCSIKEFGSV